MEFQNAYSEPVRSSDLDCADPSLAQQQFKDEVDINVLLERFRVTGEMPQGVRLPTYGDFTGISDYRQAAEAIRVAKDAFMSLPADVRKRFDNDAAAFVEFCSDKGNLEELRKLGLAPAAVSSGAGAEPQVGAPSAAASASEGRPMV